MLDEQIGITQQIPSNLGNKVSLDNEYSSFKMNQLCKVCGEPAAGYHFGAFTCEGCKSFFGRTHSNQAQMGECKNGGNCAINRKNRTSCKACRLQKCLAVGMSKHGSRYGRRSNWFKIHCLLQTQKDQNGSSDPDHDHDELSSERTVSTPSSLKSGPNNQHRSKPVHVPKSFCSPLDHDDHHRHRSSSPKLASFINPLFAGNPLMFPPGLLPMIPPHANRESMAEMDQMRADFFRFFLASCQNSGFPNGQQQHIPRMPFSPLLEKKAAFQSPPPSPPRKRSPSDMDDSESLAQDEPLDLSAKRMRIPSNKFCGSNASDGSRNLTPQSIEPDTDIDEEEPADEELADEELADVEEHFRRSVNRAESILDLSRK